MMDIKNGYSKSDVGYVPFLIKLSVQPHEVKHFYMKCTIEDLDYRTSASGHSGMRGMELIPDIPKNPNKKKLSIYWTSGHEGH